MNVPSLYVVKGLLILDNDGNRIISKYYDDQFQSVKEQKDFEKSLFQKTYKANSEIIMLDGMTIVYRSSVDLFFYIVGSTSENEIMLMNLLNCLFDSVSQMLRKNVEKKYLYDNLDLVFLLCDEICDNGVIVESDATLALQRVCFKADDVPLGEQTVVDVLRSAKEQFKWSILK
jgi:hypothetical protein